MQVNTNKHFFLRQTLKLWYFPLALSAQDQAWYAVLTSGLTTEQAKALQEIVVTADQRKAAKESKLIEKRGGFAFTQQTVPSSFKFGS